MKKRKRDAHLPTGKQKALAAKWHELRDRVSEWAEYLQATTGPPNPSRAEAILNAHRVAQNLDLERRSLTGDWDF